MKKTPRYGIYLVMRYLLLSLTLLFAAGCTTKTTTKKDPDPKKIKKVTKIEPVKPKPIPYPVDTAPLFQTERNFKRRPLPAIKPGHYRQLLPITLPKEMKLTKKLLHTLFTTLDTPYGIKAPNFLLNNNTLFIVAYSPFMDSNQTTRHHAMLQLEIASTVVFQKLKKGADQFQKPIYIPFLAPDGTIWICGIWRMKPAVARFYKIYKKNHKLTDYFSHLSLQYSNLLISNSPLNKG